MSTGMVRPSTHTWVRWARAGLGRINAAAMQARMVDLIGKCTAVVPPTTQAATSHRSDRVRRLCATDHAGGDEPSLLSHQTIMGARCATARSVLLSLGAHGRRRQPRGCAVYGRARTS